MTEPLRQLDQVRDTEGFSPRTRPRVIEMIQEHMERKNQSRTSSISGEEPYVMDLPELRVIGWENKNEAGQPYADVWSYVFGDFDIDARFDSIPSKRQKSGCYLGMFQSHSTVPKLWEAPAWDEGFFLAVEVEDWGWMPEGLIGKTIPPSKYAIFIARGVPGEAFYRTWQYIHQDWLPQSDYAVNEQGVFFVNYTEKSGPSDERFEAHLCVPVIEKGK